MQIEYSDLIFLLSCDRKLVVLFDIAIEPSRSFHTDKVSILDTCRYLHVISLNEKYLYLFTNDPWLVGWTSNAITAYHLL